MVRPLAGWGRFPVETCRVYRPEKRAALEEILASGPETSYIARGLGRSYGDAALNRDAGVISFERLNRLIAFDPATAVLESEAGVTLADILELFMPRGYFLPVVPGTKFVTLGGAIANDIHGKNHHRVGTISNFVLDLHLKTPGGEVIHCSPTENADVFWATIGGLGLTGLIVSARIRLKPITAAYVLVDYLKVANFEEAIGAMTDSDRLYEFSVAWIDCLARGKMLGRSILMRANPADSGDLPARDGDPLSATRRSEHSIPFDFPSGLLNLSTVRAFNSLFHAVHRTTSRVLVDLEHYFFPLDSIANWNRMYGRRGFVQYQLVLPLETSRAGLMEILDRLSASGRGSFLGVLKRFGDANFGILSFPFAGYTLALDLPVDDGLVSFLRELDAIVLRHGGRLYPAKDATTTRESFAAMYPRIEEFRQIKARLDPTNRLSSSLARRVGIVPS